MNDKITKISKKVGDYFAKKFKDGDNTLFTEISETAIDGFIEEIKKDNPVLAAWVEEWREKNLKETKNKKEKTYTYSGSCLDLDDEINCGCYTISKRKKKKSSGSCYDSDDGGCGISSSSSSGGCGSSSSSFYGGC